MTGLVLPATWILALGLGIFGLEVAKEHPSSIDDTEEFLCWSLCRAFRPGLVGMAQWDKLRVQALLIIGKNRTFSSILANQNLLFF